MADRDQIEEIKRRLDIVSVVKEYVPTLKKTGRNHFGLCPFHNENSPSFSVNQELGIYKCFGCSESGDVIKFIEKIEGLEFIKALEIAAKKAGVELKVTSSPEAKKARQEKDRVYEANMLAAQFYQHLLLNHKAGEKGLTYAKSRRLGSTILKKFMIGYAPEGFNNLQNFLIKKGFKQQELIRWGLLAEKNGRAYDKFRERLMFPIFNHLGDIAGFSGRIIDKNSKAPKYLNSPETPVYHKSEIVFGLFQAKEAIRKNGFAILVEGNVDILTSHQAGVENIVAPLGTALTEEQLKMIKRYADEIYLAFDTDQAGEKAMFRALEMAESLQIKVKALELGDFQDVDELISKEGNWKEVIKSASPVIDHIMDSAAKRHDLKSAEGKDSYAKLILGFIIKLKSSIEKAHYLDLLSSRIHVDMPILRQELAKLGDTNEISSVKKVIENKLEKNSREEYLLASLVAHPEFVSKISYDKIQEVIPEQLRSFAQKILSFKETAELTKHLTPAEHETYADLKLKRVELIGNEKEFIREIELIVRLIRITQLDSRIRELRYAKDEEEQKQLAKLINEMGKLKAHNP